MKKLFTSSGILWSCFVALAMMMISQNARAEYVKLTAIDGKLSWGQGDPSGKECYPKLVDANINTKWGGWFDPSLSDEDGYPNNPDNFANIMYIIVKAEKAVVPEFYFLVTGNDTGGNPGRNWASWKIYGGNFASDADAVREGEGWTLIDDRQDEPLPAQNFGNVTLDFSEAPTTAYQYFWIEIEKTVEGANVYQQMSEWGLGSYGEFEKYLEDLANQGTETDEPVKYSFLEVDSNTAGFGGEGCANLFDGDTGTKWCTGFTNRQEGETTNGSYFIFKASRSMVPSYYSLTTANDTQSNPGRNWKQWHIYGMNASSDKDATRASEEWVLLDSKRNIGTDQLPAANYTQAFFTLSEENTTAYRYFKVEIDQAATSGLIQMSEFTLGDEYTFILDRDAVVKGLEDEFDPDLFAEKALLDEMSALIASIGASTDPMKLGDLNAEADAMLAKIINSAKNYAELTTARNQALNQLADNDVADVVLEYVKSWISETDAIAPNEDYPAGNYAYIVANRQLTGEEASAEAKRFSSILMNNTNETPEPIGDVGYEFICGTTDNWQDYESPAQLIDGDRDNTKWGTATSGDRWLVFKANEPIKPTYYGLVTGGDTGTYTDRNWKNWKIWAANFDEELDPEAEGFDASAVKNSDKWVLIDVKENVGTDVLKTTSLFESYINLSIGCAEPYKYFKIEVYHQGGMQMNEFTFYNMGDLQEYRETFISEFEDYDTEDWKPAYIGYLNDYNEKYKELCTTVYAPDLMKIKNELTDLQALIEESNLYYADYEVVVQDVEGLFIDAENLSAWQTGYTTENVAPCAKYPRGTYGYVMENLSLDNDEIQAEMTYLQRIIDAVDNNLYILLGGHTVGEWGDGFYGQLIDGIDKDSEEKNEDGSPVQKGTKWGGQADANGDTYIIFRTYDPVNPFFYTLTTGNDTGTHTGRNWGTWYIYGANFEGDGDATKDAEGWVLIDAKEDVGQDRLHPVNEQPSYFGFSTETTVPYLYYKVVVTKAYSGTAIQMNELHFGTAEEFEAIKDEYTEAAKAFDTDVVAQKSLIEDYEAAIPGIDESMNMEALFRANYVLETLREQINASAAMYAKLKEKVEDTQAYLVENPLAESEALTKLMNYMTTDEEPSETYPNGTYTYIYDEHVVNDSIVGVEIEFIETMKASAVAAGYGKGMDITSLIVNRTFKKAGDMLKDGEGKNIGREAEGWDGYIYRTAKADDDNYYAAEFCNENRTFDVSQTLTGMKNGFYKVTLNAAYRPNGEKYSYAYAPMAYANDIKTYVPAIREEMATEDDRWKGIYDDKPIYDGVEFTADDPEANAENKPEVLGYVIWGCEGAANAFAQDRYAITMIAQVTDGTLTFGVKNEGTQGNEWTAVGNFGLWYLGETSDEPDFFKESTNYNGYRITTLIETYQPYSAGVVLAGQNYPDAPNFGEAQKALLKENSGVATYEAAKLVGETMQSIYETKKAYAALFEAGGKVYHKWFEGKVVEDQVEEDYGALRDNIDAGVYADAEAALAAKAELYAKWPDYLEVKATSSIICEQDLKSFSFDITTVGARPWISLTGLYEPLEEDEAFLAFDYMADQDVKNGMFMYETPNLLTDVKDVIPTLPMTRTWTTVYYNITNAIKAYQYGAVDHAIHWYVNYDLKKDDEALKLSARNFRFMTKAQMKAEGGKPLNFMSGDVNCDVEIDIADAVSVLNAMAGEDVTGDADVNGDGKVDIADFVTVLNIMAGIE